MSGIILQNKTNYQPRTFTEINYEGLGKGMRILWNPAVGPVDLVTGKIWSPAGNSSIIPSKYGKVFSFDGVDDYYSFTGYPELTSNIGTFFCFCPVVGNQDNFGHVFLGSASPGAVAFQISQNGDVQIFGGGFGSSQISNWYNTTNRAVVFSSGGTATTCKLYIDGKNSGVTWSGAPIAWGSGNKTFNFGRYPGGTSWDYNGTILVAGLTDAIWGEKEAREFSKNPFAVFKTNKRRILNIPSSGPTYFETDFAYSGSSDFIGERTSIFSIYYNFNGVTDTTLSNLSVTNSDTNISCSSTTNIQSQKIHSVTYTANGTCVVTYQVGPDLATSTFLQDDFSGSAGQDVIAYNNDWFKSIYNAADQQFIITDEQRAITTSSASGTPVFYHRNIPATADYDVSADIHIKSAVETVGIIGRASGDTTRNHYMAQFTASTVKLFKVVGWISATQLASKGITLTAGQTYNLKLSMFGDSIKVYVDNVEQIAVTDSAITEKGMAGIRNFYSTPISYTTGMHIDNFLGTNTNILNKNIISINIFPSGTSISDPKIQSIISQDLSSSGNTTVDVEQYSVNNVEISSVGVTTTELINSIISSSEISSEGLSVTDISNTIIKPSDTEISGVGIQSTETQKIVNVNANSSGISTQTFNDSIIQNKSFNSDGISNIDIKSAYIHLCELVSNSSSVEELISAITHNAEISSVGSCIVTFEQGADGGITYISVDMIISGSSTSLPTIQKVFNSSLSLDSNSSTNLKDNIISLSNVLSSGISSTDINTQKLLSRDIVITGESTTSIIHNIILNSRIISSGNTEQIINSASIQNTDIESIGSSILNFLDNFIQSTDFLSNGTCVVSIQQGQDGGKIIINVDFIMDGTSSINNNIGLTLNTNVQSQSSSNFISNFTKLDGQNFTASGSSIVDFIREYLILQTNRKYVSIAERRNYVSSVERRNYVSKVKG